MRPSRSYSLRGGSCATRRICCPSVQGPSFFFNPGYGFVSWIMAIITIQPLLTIHRQRPTRPMAVENGRVVQSAGVPDRKHAPGVRPELKSGPEESGPEELGCAT